MQIQRQRRLPAPKGNRGNLATLRAKEQFFGMLFAGPAILGFLIFVLGPMIASLGFSLTDYTVFNTPSFVGLTNYADLFSGTDTFFYPALRVTFLFVLMNVPASILFAFLMSLILNADIKGRAVFRAILYLPSIVPAVATAMIWMWLFNPDLGLINMALSAVGLPTSLWIYGESSVLPSIVLMGLWGSGGTIVIFLAGLSGIPVQYYEAIEVDGGNALHQFRHITFPMMTPTIFFNAVMGIIGSFQVFGQAYILTQGGPNNASLFYVFYLWREAFRNARMGYASAIAWVLFVIILFFTMLVFKSSNTWVYYEGERKNG